jgi:hypothetical protein
MTGIHSETESDQRFRQFNGEVFFAPTNSWQLAIWAITRRTRSVNPVELTSPPNVETFAKLYSTRTHAPVLWFTPAASLGDETYHFLHRLPGIGRIVVLCENVEKGLPETDIGNLKAILDEAWQWHRAPGFLNYRGAGPHTLSFLSSQSQSQASGFFQRV